MDGRDKVVKHIVNLLCQFSVHEHRGTAMLLEMYLVGAIMTAAISPRLYLSSLRRIRSRVGMTNAKVLPDPVTAYAVSY